MKKMFRKIATFILLVCSIFVTAGCYGKAPEELYGRYDLVSFSEYFDYYYIELFENNDFKLEYKGNGVVDDLEGTFSYRKTYIRVFYEEDGTNYYEDLQYNPEEQTLSQTSESDGVEMTLVFKKAVTEENPTENSNSETIAQ